VALQPINIVYSFLKTFKYSKKGIGSKEAVSRQLP
jgi:hypothetical protein